MCTLTGVPARGGLRIGFNRDELRSRPAALPPVIRTFGSRKAVMPVDPASNGTWLAASDAGLIIALLNGSGPRQPAVRSRGTIIPQLLGAPNLMRAVTAAMSLRFSDYDAFHLVLTDARKHFEIVWDRERFAVHSAIGARPFMITSSSLGLDAVAAARRALFEELVGNAVDPVAGQTSFHAHRWEDRPEISVDMERDDARTVSRSIVWMTSARATFFHETADGDDATTVTLPMPALREAVA